MEENEMTSDTTQKIESKSTPKLTVFPLIALIFYEVSGGPFGVEDSIKSGGGPLLSILGFMIFPIIWSLPEALITAELATTYPQNGGYVVWITSAFGPFWGFQEGFWKWFGGVMDNALYPVLFLDYLKHSFPVFENLSARIPALLLITISLTYLNYRGLHIVGFTAVLLAVFSLCPFVVMGLLSIPRLRPKQWFVVDFKQVDYRGFFNCMFWNLNYWDKASTLVGEVENPSKNFPRATFGAVLLVMLSYLIPILASTGALRNNEASEWTDGYFAEVGLLIGGVWLQWWIQAAAAMSNLGLFEAEMSSDAFQLLGMSEMGMLPPIFAARSKYGTPTFSILCSASGVIFLSWLTFQEIIEFQNFIYSIAMLLEFAAFLKLRIMRPDLHRPYKVPLKTFGCVVLCTPPSILLVLVMCLASYKTILVSIIVVALSFTLYPILALHSKNEKRIEEPSTDLVESEETLPTSVVRNEETVDDASVSLLLNTDAIQPSKQG
ncbi:hypothetical protein RND81_06G192800 [Saponaria officinalis]|uniref:Polyamine transporter At3g19553 n=1 Tax=Saponaria officinalis TaxID=3572 RepID=A0AAW1KBW6_SAPOF